MEHVPTKENSINKERHGVMAVPMIVLVMMPVGDHTAVITSKCKY